MASEFVRGKVKAKDSKGQKYEEYLPNCLESMDSDELFAFWQQLREFVTEKGLRASVAKNKDDTEIRATIEEPAGKSAFIVTLVDLMNSRKVVYVRKEDQDAFKITETKTTLRRAFDSVHRLQRTADAFSEHCEKLYAANQDELQDTKFLDKVRNFQSTHLELQQAQNKQTAKSQELAHTMGEYANEIDSILRKKNISDMDFEIRLIEFTLALNLFDTSIIYGTLINLKYLIKKIGTRGLTMAYILKHMAWEKGGEAKEFAKRKAGEFAENVDSLARRKAREAEALRKKGVKYAGEKLDEAAALRKRGVKYVGEQAGKFAENVDSLARRKAAEALSLGKKAKTAGYNAGLEGIRLGKKVKTAGYNAGLEGIRLGKKAKTVGYNAGLEGIRLGKKAKTAGYNAGVGLATGAAILGMGLYEGGKAVGRAAGNKLERLGNQATLWSVLKMEVERAKNELQPKNQLQAGRFDIGAHGVNFLNLAGRIPGGLAMVLYIPAKIGVGMMNERYSFVNQIKLGVTGSLVGDIAKNDNFKLLKLPNSNNKNVFITTSNFASGKTEGAAADVTKEKDGYVVKLIANNEDDCKEMLDFLCKAFKKSDGNKITISGRTDPRVEEEERLIREYISAHRDLQIEFASAALTNRRGSRDEV